MKLKIRKDDFMRGLRLASGVADRKATLPILGCALLRATKAGGLTVAASDLAVSAQAALPATVEREGEIAVPARQLHDVVKELPGDEVRVETDATKRTTLKAARSEFTLLGSDAKDYPKLPSGEAPATKVDAPMLREMMRLTGFSVSTDETRAHLAALLFEAKGGKAVCVSTDGHRLSKAGRDLPGVPECAGVLIPRKGVQEILRLLDGREAPVGLSFGGGVAHVRADDVSLWARLTDGAFPPWEQVIPKDADRGAVVSRTGLMEALGRAAIMADRTNGITLTLGKGLLRIEAKNPDQGDAMEEVEAETKGAEIKVGLNAAYLREWLGEASAEKVRVSMSDQLDPVVLRPDDGSDYVGVVMPMRI
jgi:DNA polymerase-3 subunit beta